MTAYRGVSVYQMITIVGIVAVLVILSIIFTKGNNEEFVLDTTQEEIQETGGVLGVSSVSKYFIFEDEILGSIPSYGFVTEQEPKTYTDNQNGFEFEVYEDFSQESGAVVRLPFYWQERYEGATLQDDVEMFVVNSSYQSFVSGITYGLGDTFITDNEVVVTPRTTGYGDKFVHQAYLDLEEGKTLLLELRTNTEQYPEQLKSYIETVQQV